MIHVYKTLVKLWPIYKRDDHALKCILDLTNGVISINEVCPNCANFLSVASFSRVCQVPVVNIPGYELAMNYHAR